MKHDYKNGGSAPYAPHVLFTPLKSTKKLAPENNSYWDSIPNLGSFFCLPKRTKPRKGQFPVSFSRQATNSFLVLTFLRTIAPHKLPGLQAPEPSSLTSTVNAETTQRNARGESPVNQQDLLIKKAMIKHTHSPRHDMSLPIAPFPKGQGGRSGGGGGLKDPLVPPRSTEIPLMGQYKRQQTKWIPVFTGMTA
jgi:hypothetical protein